MYRQLKIEKKKDQNVDEKEKKLFLCSEENCTRGLQRHSWPGKQIVFGKCIQAIDRDTLLDRAKLKYAARLCQGEASANITID